MGRNGLLVDFGGVLTTSVARSFRAWCVKLGLPPELARETFVEAYAEPDDAGPVHLMETGQLTGEEFAAFMAAALSDRSGVEVAADGLLEGMFAEVTLDERMLTAVAAARRAGVRTGLVSNSWGTQPAREGYPRERFDELFDTVVISGEVGLRKPDPAIFALAADRLNLPPAACVFVDDLDTNVRAAEAAGMRGLHHRRTEQTLPRLAALLGLEPSVLGI